MNFFAKELENLKENAPLSNGTVTASGALYVPLSGGLLAKIEFTRTWRREHCDALRATILNIESGPVDSAVFKFHEIMGEKKISAGSGPDRKIRPYIAASDESESEPAWHLYTPGRSDWAVMGTAIARYLKIFNTKQEKK